MVIFITSQKLHLKKCQKKKKLNPIMGKMNRNGKKRCKLIKILAQWANDLPRVNNNDSRTTLIDIQVFFVLDFQQVIAPLSRLTVPKNEVIHLEFLQYVQIGWELCLWSHLPKKSLMENFFLCSCYFDGKQFLMNLLLK